MLLRLSSRRQGSTRNEYLSAKGRKRDIAARNSFQDESPDIEATAGQIGPPAGLWRGSGSTAMRRIWDKEWSGREHRFV